MFEMQNIYYIVKPHIKMSLYYRKILWEIYLNNELCLCVTRQFLYQQISLSY